MSQSHSHSMKNLEITRIAAERGVSPAQYDLALCYYNGEGVEKDFLQAVKWWRKAAEQGHVRAQCSLGHCYFNGEGVPQDDVQAVSWYRKAAEQGYARGQGSMGYCYDGGFGVAMDEVQAVDWYLKAAEQGDVAAQCNLANFYTTGRVSGKVLAKDPVQAVKWYRKAAEQGESRAQYELGNIYYSGRGVTKDKIESYAYYKLSVSSAWKAQNRFEIWNYADGQLNACQSEMTEGQIAAGDKRVLELQKEIEANIAAKQADK